MSKERQRRREERDREAALRTAARAAQAERTERHRARKQTLTSWLPQGRSKDTGVLAERRRRQTGFVIAFTIAINLLAFVFLHEWSARAMVVVVSLLAAPVLHTLLFRR